MSEAQDATTQATRFNDTAQDGVDMLTTKTCRVCGQTKFLNAFYHVRRNYPNGKVREEIRPYCKACDNARRLEYQHKERDAKAARNGRTPNGLKVTADNRTGGKKVASVTTSAGYHFDTRFIKRLTRIGKILDANKWRDYTYMLTSVDNQMLAAAGLPAGDVQILRKALNHYDRDMLHYIFNVDLPAKVTATPASAPAPAPAQAVATVEPPVQPLVEAMPEGESESESESETVLSAVVPYVPTYVPDPFDEPGQPEPEELSTGFDMARVTELAGRVGSAGRTEQDIEAAAELIISSRAIMNDLAVQIKEAEARVAQLQGMWNDANNSRLTAINMLREL